MRIFDIDWRIHTIKLWLTLYVGSTLTVMFNY